MNSISGFRGDVMAEGSRFQPVNGRYRDSGGGLSRDYYMDAQPLDYSTKRSQHGLPLSLTSRDTSAGLAGNASNTSIFTKVLSPQSRMSPRECPPAPENGLSPRSGRHSPMSYSPAPHYASYNQVHGRSYSPSPAYQQLLHAQPPPPAPPPVPPAAQVSPTIPAVASSFHTQSAVNSLILAQLQANPILFSTLLAKSNLMAHQQQLQIKAQAQAQGCNPRMSPPCPEPPLAGFSGGSFGVAGLGTGTLDMMQLKNHSRDPMGPTSGVMHNTTQEEIALMERSNEEYRNFRDRFMTEASKMKQRRGGRRSSHPGAVSGTGNSMGAADDVASEGSIDVVSGGERSDDGESEGVKDDYVYEDHKTEADRPDTGDEACDMVVLKKRNNDGMEITLKDEAYWERRRRNNEAAKRSRDARRAKEEEIAIRGAFLEQENMKLRAELSTLKSETAKLRCMLYNS